MMICIHFHRNVLCKRSRRNGPLENVSMSQCGTPIKNSPLKCATFFSVLRYWVRELSSGFISSMQLLASILLMQPLQWYVGGQHTKAWWTVNSIDFTGGRATLIGNCKDGSLMLLVWDLSWNLPCKCS